MNEPSWTIEVAVCDELCAHLNSNVPAELVVIVPCISRCAINFDPNVTVETVLSAVCIAIEDGAGVVCINRDVAL